MYFQLSKLILWPRLDEEPRVVDFELGVVNVISGASKTGAVGGAQSFSVLRRQPLLSAPPARE